MPEEFRVSGRICKLDYHGLSEGYSVGIILRQFKADKIVLVNGSEEETKEVKGMLNEDKFVIENSFGNYNGDIKISNFTTEVVECQNKLYHFKESGTDDLEYVQVRGHIRLMRTDKLVKVDYSTVTFQEEDTTPGTQSLSSSLVRPNPEYSSLKQFKLLVFKDMLEKNGFLPILEYGRLNLGGKIFIKLQNGRLNIEGVFGPDYFMVRSLLYEHFLN